MKVEHSITRPGSIVYHPMYINNCDKNLTVDCLTFKFIVSFIVHDKLSDRVENKSDLEGE